MKIDVAAAATDDDHLFTPECAYAARWRGSIQFVAGLCQDRCSARRTTNGEGMPEETHATSSLSAGLREGIEVVSVAIEVLAICIIVVGIVIGTFNYVRRSSAKPPDSSAYGRYKARMGRSLLLGLEILVAADIIRTVALEPTLNAIAALGLLVLVRTFLSWALVVEMEGRWPWQPRTQGETEPPAWHAG